MKHANIERSFEAAQLALNQFRDGLVEGGFESALATYRQMIETLAAQRLILDVAGDTHLDQAFRDLGRDRTSDRSDA